MTIFCKYLSILFLTYSANFDVGVVGGTLLKLTAAQSAWTEQHKMTCFDFKCSGFEFLWHSFLCCGSLYYKLDFFFGLSLAYCVLHALA